MDIRVHCELTHLSKTTDCLPHATTPLENVANRAVNNEHRKVELRGRLYQHPVLACHEKHTLVAASSASSVEPRRNIVFARLVDGVFGVEGPRDSVME